MSLPWYELGAIALGLAMDAFAVAIATSVSLGEVSRRQVFRLAWHFGLFQALMPVIGWYGGVTIESAIRAWDHWVAFGLLVFVGGKSIREAWQEEGRADGTSNDPTCGASLVLLSIATSIDALAVGLSFAALRVRIWTPSIVIGVVAALLTVLGMLFGSRLGRRFGRRMEFFGGLVLIGIAIKIVAAHTLAA